MDEDGNELSGTAETEECFPILAFVLPPEYTMAEDDVIAISDEVLTLFRGKTFYTVYDAETGMIYILISLARPGLLVMDMGQAEPQEMIPLPENILIPGDGEETAPTIERCIYQDSLYDDRINESFRECLKEVSIIK